MVKIANISNGYKNKVLINLLRERGTMINDSNIKGLEKLEKKIDFTIE
jgi:hypothetical protein